MIGGRKLKDTHYKLERILDVETLPLSEILRRYEDKFVSPSFLTIDVEGWKSRWCRH